MCGTIAGAATGMIVPAGELVVVSAAETTAVVLMAALLQVTGSGRRTGVMGAAPCPHHPLLQEPATATLER